MSQDDEYTMKGNWIPLLLLSWSDLWLITQYYNNGCIKHLMSRHVFTLWRVCVEIKRIRIRIRKLLVSFLFHLGQSAIWSEDVRDVFSATMNYIHVLKKKVTGALTLGFRDIIFVVQDPSWSVQRLTKKCFLIFSDNDRLHFCHSLQESVPAAAI